MAGTSLFNFRESTIVPPIPCTHCGNNMNCVRRTPEQGGERQEFACTCGNTTERVVGTEMSDQEVQATAEKLLGKPRPGSR